MSNPFHVGDSVMHNVASWSQPSSTLTVTHIKNLKVAASDSKGKRFIGNYGCFKLIVRGNSDQHLTR